MRYPFLYLFLSYFLFFAASADEIAEGKKIVLHGNEKGGLPCLTCHLENGEGMQQNGFPQLAGMNRAYLIKQMKDYQGPLRKNDVMNPIAKALSDEEIKNVSAYFASLPVVNKSEEGPSDEKWNEGKWIAERGLWNKKIPACFSCHGPDGSGVGESFPPLSNQGKIYLTKALLAFKDGSRKNDPQNLMRTIAGKLTTKEREAVVHYLSSLPAKTQEEKK